MQKKQWRESNPEKAEGEKTGVQWMAGRLLRRSGSDDGRAGERRELAANPSFSARSKALSRRTNKSSELIMSSCGTTAVKSFLFVRGWTGEGLFFMFCLQLSIRCGKFVWMNQGFLFLFSSKAFSRRTNKSSELIMSSCKATAIKSFLFVCGWIRGRFVLYVLSAVVHPLRKVCLE